MASLKDVKVKISGVGKTKQITKAMNMVASAKLRGAQSRMERFSSYAASFRDMLDGLATPDAEISHPLLQPREDVKAIGIVLVTSDRGLCGSFNVNIINSALKLAARYKSENKNVVFYCAGRKGRDAIRKTGYPIAGDITGRMGLLTFPVADRLGIELINAFQSGTLDEVVLVAGAFVNLVRQVPKVTPLLPLAPTPEHETASGASTDYIYEPEGEALLGALLPRIVKAMIYRGLLDTATSEQAARMTAMDNATRNCDDLINSLTQLFNKTRQAAITRDLMDIVGGVEALNG